MESLDISEDFWTEARVRYNIVRSANSRLGWKAEVDSIEDLLSIKTDSRPHRGITRY